MWLPDNTKISGEYTVKGWKVCKKGISDFSNIPLWEEAYTNFFWTRIKTRYLTPIRILLKDRICAGEGFSIVTLQCTLIEFLESTYQGIKYRHLKKGEELKQFEYIKSQKIFESFLLNREPFKQHFDKNLATDFYKAVRCGLFHNAATKGRWVISAKCLNKIIEKTPTKIIIYRESFQKALEHYLKLYKQELLGSDERKSAFIRKIDSLCES